MSHQTEKLKNTRSKLKKIEKNTLPGIDKLMGMIQKTKLKNTVIIAFVISICLVILIYYHGIKVVQSTNLDVNL